MFLDIGAGILLSIASAHFLDNEVTWLWIVVAIIFALLPDIDMIVYGAKKLITGKGADDHRSFTHYPIIYIPTATIIFLYINTNYGILFLLCVYFHLIHDTFWLGWGISWLWPFSDRKFKFFPDKDGKITRTPLLTWAKDEEQIIFKKYHNPTWIQDFYFRPNIIAYTEYGVFIVAIIVLLYTI